MRLRSTSENPTGFSDGKWETLSIESTRGTGAGIYKKKKVSLWLLGLARVMTACQYNDDTYILHGSISVRCAHSWQLLIMIMRTYRVSQEECARLRESVPYVKVYRYNPKHLYPKLNGYGDNGPRKVGAFCSSKYCNLHS